MRARLSKVPISYCHCPNCGNTMPIPRKPGQARNRNHIKNLFCPYCGMVVQMIEERECDAWKNMAGDVLTHSH